MARPRDWLNTPGSGVLYGNGFNHKTDVHTSVFGFRQASSNDSAQRILKRRFKSVTTKGATLQIGTKTFRRATNYRRCVAEIIGRSFDFWIPDAFGKVAHLYGANSVYHNQRLLQMGSNLGWSFTDGGVQTSNSAEERAKAKAYSKLRNQMLSLPVALGESVKTVRLIADLVRDILALYRLFRGRISPEYRKSRTYARFRTAYGKRLGRYDSDAFTKSANAFLAFKYGVQPLVSDLYGAITLFQRGFDESKLLFSVAGEEKEAYDASGLFVARSDQIVSGTLEGDVRAIYWCQFDLYSRVMALGLDNPFLAAWELVPYSFVLDWLVPIGRWLESLSATVGTIFVDGSILKRVYGTATAQNMVKSTLHGAPPSAEVRTFGMNRIGLPGFPWVVPTIKSPFSTPNVLSAAALITQTVGDRRYR